LFAPPACIRDARRSDDSGDMNLERAACLDPSIEAFPIGALDRMRIGPCNRA